MPNRTSPPPASAEPGPIGLDLGAAGVRAMQLSLARGVPTVRAAVSQPQAPAGDAGLAGAALRDRVRRAMEAAPFAGRRVVAAVPRHLLRVKTVRLPVAPGDAREAAALTAPVLAAAAKEAAGLFPFDPADSIVQWLPAGPARQGGEVRLEVIALAVPRQELDRFVSDLDAAGLIVESLDAESCAAWRSAGPAPAAEPESADSSPGEPRASHVLIDVGYRQTRVMIGRGPRLSFIRPIDVGAEHLDQALSRKLGVSPAEARLIRRHVTSPAAGAPHFPLEGGADREAVRQALCDATRSTVEQLARGLATYLRYHAVTFRGPGPRCVHLLGAEADNELLAGSLSSLLGLRVDRGNPLARLDASAMSPADREAAGTWAVAAGLALKKLPGRGPLATPAFRSTSTRPEVARD